MSAIDNVEKILHRTESLFSKGDYGEGISHAIKGYLLSEELNDEAKIIIFLTMIKIMCEKIIGAKLGEENNSEIDRCSFCGEGGETLNMMHGAEGKICENCYKLAKEYFSSVDE